MKENKKGGVLRIVVFAFLAAIFMCCCFFVFVLRDDTSPENNNSDVSTSSPDKVEDTPESITLESATPEGENIGLVFGLSPIDVTTNLEERDFTCELSDGEIYYVRHCVREYSVGSNSIRMLVIVYGRELFTVDFITSEVIQYGVEPNKDIATSFLSFMATMPYDDSVPDKAREWVETTLPSLSGEVGDVRTEYFGGVKYELFGNPSSVYWLNIGELK